MRSRRSAKIASLALAMILLASVGLMPGSAALAAGGAMFRAAELPSVPDKGAAPGNDEFVLLYDQAADLYIDKSDWEGAAIALASLQSDIELVGGKKPAIKNDASGLSDMAVLAGTIGKSDVIDQLVNEKKIDVSKVTGKWESYILEVVENPLPGVSRALVVAGSDKRGTIYGIYKISEMIGVSPWVWWADSVPVRQGKLTFAGDLRIEQGEPSVKYRGIFLNDESPSLSGWVSKNFGSLKNSSATKGYDHEFYAKVFELILRLKGNYLWPTMWNNSFHTDDPLNSETANTYGVVMGTSHQEHMTCADKEWSWSSLGEWNYSTNKDKIYQFWKDGVTERKDYESILTLGMRGQADTAILGPGATLGDNMNLIKNVLSDQRKIIEDVYGTADAPPQLLALYKEVEDFYYGDATYGSLDVPDDVTLLLCDDNFGNVRTLPTEAMRKRSGGYGMYYHFDYRGGPISYEWINQTPINKVWEQMTTAYDAGVDRIWIVNVGDLKPMELPIDYFLNLAYDYEQWSPANKVEEFTRDFAAREFGEDVADDAADVLNGYTKILGARKAEVVLPDPSTFSLTSFDEADRTLSEFEAVVAKAEMVYDKLPAHKKDTFYQLALYPARAAMNVYKANIYAAWSCWLAEQKLPAANEYAKLARAAFDADAKDMEYYNTEMSGGKWDGIMRQNHIGYTTWDGPSTGVAPSIMPKTGEVTPEAGSELAVRVQGGSAIIRDGTASLPVFSSLSIESRYFDIFNGKSFPFAFTVSADADWIKLSTAQGICVNQTRVGVSVDWSKVTKNSTASITITGAGATVKVNVAANMFSENLSDKTYVETHGYVSINPSRYTSASSGSDKWTVIDDYGRDGDSVKVLPNGKSYAEGDSKAPYVEYSFYIQTAGAYNVNTFIAPTNNLVHSTNTPLLEQLRFSTQMDGGERKTGSGLLNASFAADGGNPTWAYGVECNTRMVTMEHGNLTAGLHTLRIYAVDPAVVIQKIVIAPASAKQTIAAAAPQTNHFMDSYFGPPESYYAGTKSTSVSYPVLNAGIEQFKASDVEVTFADSDGKVIQKVTAQATNGSKLTAGQIASVTPPTKVDYRFSGWLMPNGALLTEQIIFTEPTTVKAKYISTAAATYTYLPNGGTGSSNVAEAAAETKVVIEENLFTSNGKVFVAWNTKADGSGNTYSPGMEVIAHEPMELYAIWADKLPATRASSATTDGRAYNAFDGNATTALKLLGIANEWIEIGLNGSYTIDSLYVMEDGNNIQGYEVQYWNAAEGQWATAATGTGIGSSGDIQFFQAQAVTTDRLRLNIQSAQNPPVIKEISLQPFVNWGLAANGASVTTLPSDGEGEADAIIDGDRIDYTKRWRINSQAGFATPITLMLAEQKNISVVNIFSITGLWNTKPVDIKRDTKGSTALGTIRNLKLEYTADGKTWTALPGGTITENENSWISVVLDAPIAMTGLRFTVPDQANSDFNDSWIRVVEFEALELVSTKDMVNVDGTSAPGVTTPGATNPGTTTPEATNPSATNPGSTDPSKSGSSAPKTGDDFAVYGIIALLMLAAAGSGVVLTLRKKASR